MLERIGEMVRALFGEVGKLREANQEMWKDIRSLRETNALLRMEIEDWRERHAKVEATAEESQSVITRLQAEIEDHKRDFEEVRSVNTRAQQAHEDVQRDLEEKLKAYEAAVAEANRAAHVAGSKNHELAAELAELKSDYQEMTGRVGGLTRANNDLEAELEQARAKTEVVERDLEAVLARVSEVLEGAQEAVAEAAPD